MEKLIKTMDNIIAEIEEVMAVIEKENLQNELLVLNFCDKLNKLSIRF